MISIKIDFERVNFTPRALSSVSEGSRVQLSLPHHCWMAMVKMWKAKEITHFGWVGKCTEVESQTRAKRHRLKARFGCCLIAYIPLEDFPLFVSSAFAFQLANGGKQFSIWLSLMVGLGWAWLSLASPRPSSVWIRFSCRKSLSFSIWLSFNAR